MSAYDASQLLNEAYRQGHAVAGVAPVSGSANYTPRRQVRDAAGGGIRDLLNAAIPPGAAGAHWHRQPDGSYVAAAPGVQPNGGSRGRRLHSPETGPFIGGWRGNPNPAYGAMWGLKWNGKEWVEPNMNEDLEREAMELELDKRRKELAESGASEQLRSWLAKRLGSIE